MNSSEMSATPRRTALASVLRRFNWIEQFAIPVAIAIMETQPVVIIPMTISQPFTGTAQPWPLEAYTVTLLFVALHWWASFVEWIRQGGSHQRVQFLRIVGLTIACLATLLVHYTLLINPLAIIAVVILVTWCWKRGLDKARAGLSDEDLVSAFRAGFIALLFMFFFAVVSTDADYAPNSSGVFTAMGNAFPLFFLSGLLALSFTRIALIRRDNARSSSASIFDPTRTWLVVLTLAWIVLVVFVIGLETFSFQSIADLFHPLWVLLGIISLFLVQIIFFLLEPFAQFFVNTFAPLLPKYISIPAPSSGKQQPVVPPVIPPEAILIGRIVLLALLLVIFIQVIGLILQRWQARQHDDDSEEEIRETLPIRALLQARRQGQSEAQQERAPELESLPANSARARYRELLQSLAWNQERLARRTNETPTEYQARLLAQLQQTPSTEIEHGEREEQCNDPAMLAALTDDYIQERYGGKPIEREEVTYSPSWIAQFVKRLSGTSNR